MIVLYNSDISLFCSRGFVIRALLRAHGLQIRASNEQMLMYISD